MTTDQERNKVNHFMSFTHDKLISPTEEAIDQKDRQALIKFKVREEVRVKQLPETSLPFWYIDPHSSAGAG